jgi:hypothetical protein
VNKRENKAGYFLQARPSKKQKPAAVSGRQFLSFEKYYSLLQ